MFAIRCRLKKLENAMCNSQPGIILVATILFFNFNIYIPHILKYNNMCVISCINVTNLNNIL